ncbi:metal-dependent hydrolase [Halanaeroarchaeum sulfurireducens]|uniref:Membrane-bound metal-dependent hydrolase n=1 Tax=Halanaeroarchaeum sulfurireducens TaxID=1604004 RepID=A0A0N9MXW1_9EURY|nr:metal-dependent hydrolase [Halanaeroarchaeum sulfurireducens]ALG82542.1 membrane-bound metal-dependent hydrolase [Halanaeroarchaeum sulfurireducens]
MYSMFVGHGLLAFAIVALVAMSADVDRDRATALAVVAGLFATVPDVDMVYALTGLVGVPGSSPLAVAESFWSASTVVHRSMTHSLAIAIPATVAFALVGRSTIATAVSFLLAASLIALGTLVSGPITGLVALAFVATGLLVGAAATRHGLGPAAVAGTAFVGLVTHPFGDVLTGQPPELFYPFPFAVFDGRVALSADPTLHLLGAFGAELAAIWLGVYAFSRLRERHLRSALKPRAAVGAAYATAVLVLRPPTVDGSYTFVFSVLAVGFVGAVPPRKHLPEGLTAVTTGLAGVTVAGMAYLLAYLTMDLAPLLALAGQPF